MSCDFGVWDKPRTLSPNRANRIYRQLIQGNFSIVQPSPKIEQFLNDLSNLYPDDVDGPWSCVHEQSPGHVLLSCVISRSSEVRKAILTLTRKHGLLCYDPQLNEITI